MSVRRISIITLGKYLLLLSALFFVQCAPGNVSALYKLYSPEDYVYWSEDVPLNWSDFQGIPSDTAGKYASDIRVYNPASIQKMNIFSPAKLTAFCVFDKKNSWVNKKLANDDLLLYNQTIFDIYELYTRTLRKTFDSTDFAVDDYKEKFQEMTEKINSDLKDTVNKFKSDTQSGQFKEAIRPWYNKIRHELDDLKKYKG